MADGWKLLLSVLFGITIATTLVTGAPVYLSYLERIGFANAIETSSSIVLNVLTTAQDVPIARESLRATEDSIDDAIRSNISPIYRDHNRYLKTQELLLNPTSQVPSPIMAIASTSTTGEQKQEEGASVGYFINLHALEEHVTILKGRMPTDTISGEAPLWVPKVESVIGRELSERLGIDVGEVVTLVSASDTNTKVFSSIVGIVTPNDPNEEYWQDKASLFFEPEVPVEPLEGVEANQNSRPIALMITQTAATKLPDLLVEPAQYSFESAFLVNVSDLENQVTLVEGRVAGDAVLAGKYGPVIEANIGVTMAGLFRLKVDDVITVTPYIDESTWVSIRVVGIIERTDLNDEYWTWGTNSFFEAGTEGPVSLPLLISREGMVEGVDGAYPGTLVNSVWYVNIDKQGLKDWSTPETLIHLHDLERGITEALPGNLTSTGIRRVLGSFERSFFVASIPLLLLLTTMVVVVLYFLSMMVSYLTKSREGDVALLRTRGLGMMGILKLYGLEALALTLVGVALAPVLAMFLVMLAGRLPFFRQLTAGAASPIEFGLLPFILAAGLGFVCFLIFVVPTVVIARANVLLQRLQASRPALSPFFYRYNLDIGLLALGGLVFWELRTRGQFVVGGLFTDVQINETLLFAPVLLLSVVGLMFVRFFPMTLRFVTGESSSLLHLMVVATVSFFGFAVTTKTLLEVDISKAIVPLGLVALMVAVYWRTMRTHRYAPRVFGLVLQTGLAFAVVATERPSPGDALFLPAMAVVLLIPAQIVFFLLRAFSRSAPAWWSLGLWRMARNPSRYTWLVLLLVLVSGLATFANTIRATLDKRDEDRTQYDVPTDMRVVSTHVSSDGWRLLDKYQNVRGVASTSPAYRSSGLGNHSLGRPFEILATDSFRDPSTSWYRQDFSNSSISDIMRVLRPNANVGPVIVPEDTRELGIWAKLGDRSPNVSLEMVVQDSLTRSRTLDLGELSDRDWTMMRASLPFDLNLPVRVVSIHVAAISGGGGEPGTVHIDDIHATLEPDGKTKMLDGFERLDRWQPITTSMSGTGSTLTYTSDSHSHSDESAALYVVERMTGKGPAGIYLSPTGGPLPVVASLSFIENAGVSVGDTFTANLGGRILLMTIRDSVEYFPTMDINRDGFVIADFNLLLGQLNALAPENESTPNEFFLDLGSSTGLAVRESVRLAEPFLVDILDQEKQTESFRLDPLITAGWRAMSLTAFAIVLFTAVIGYLAYMLVFANQNLSEMGLVRALGFGKRQMMALLAFEHIVIVFVGIGLGTWAGFRMSIMMLPLVSLNSPGEPAMPPVLVVTDWWMLIATYAVMVGGFAVMFLYVTRHVFRLNLQTVSRMEL